MCSATFLDRAERVYAAGALLNAVLSALDINRSAAALRFICPLLRLPSLTAEQLCG